MKKTLIIICILFHITSIAIAEQYLYQKHSIGPVKDYIIETKTQESGHLIKEKSEYGDHIWVLDHALNTKKWTYKNSTDNIHIIVERKQNTLHYSGIYKGNELDFSQEIDTKPWYQFIDNTLPKQFTVKDKKHFWYIRSKDLRPIEMTFINKKSEHILIKQKKVLTQKLQLKLKKWPSLLWKVVYWKDKETGLLLQKKRYANPKQMLIFKERLNE